VPGSGCPTEPLRDGGADHGRRGVALVGRCGRIGGEAGAELLELAGELAGGAQEHVAGLPLRQVGECVDHPSRGEDELAGPGRTQGLTELEGQLAIEDVEGLIEVVW
jgi:hypothetical protein